LALAKPLEDKKAGEQSAALLPKTLKSLAARSPSEKSSTVVFASSVIRLMRIGARQL
jgi:hypothetical protein